MHDNANEDNGGVERIAQPASRETVLGEAWRVQTDCVAGCGVELC